MLAYQTELGTGTMVIVVREMTDLGVAYVGVEGSVGQELHAVMVQVEVRLVEV